MLLTSENLIKMGLMGLYIEEKLGFPFCRVIEMLINAFVPVIW